MNIYTIGKSPSEELDYTKGWCNINPLDDNKIDDVIYSNLPIIVYPNKNCLNFLISYLAEWRLINSYEPIRKRKIIVYNQESFFDPLLKCLSHYRAKLPDEKNKEAINWFIYPNTKPLDIFYISSNMKEIESIAEKYSKEEYFSIKPENTKKSVIQKHDEKKYIFVPASAFGWTIYDELAFKLGENIANRGYRFINGGPDGGKLCNGPMRQSALGYIKKSQELLIAVYSELVFKNYVKEEQLEPFKNQIDIIYCGTESERKCVMINGADEVYVLPGAIGTWAEVTHSLLLNKKVKLYGDYWKDFRECLEYYSFDVEWYKCID